MIVLNILCDSGHRFEGWFASADAFRSQCERKLVNCPECNTAMVRLLPSAPYVRRAAQDVMPGDAVTKPASAQPMPDAPVLARMYHALVQVARQAENVGERFPEEARRIHYDEAPARNIRGVASADETLELLDEGILVMPAPVPHEDEFH